MVFDAAIDHIVEIEVNLIVGPVYTFFFSGLVKWDLNEPMQWVCESVAAWVFFTCGLITVFVWNVLEEERAREGEKQRQKQRRLMGYSSDAHSDRYYGSWSQKPRTQARFFTFATWVAGTQLREPSAAAFCSLHWQGAGDRSQSQGLKPEHRKWDFCQLLDQMSASPS